MRKIMICVIVLILTLSACSTGKRYFHEIEIGMTYEQVVEIIGREPDSLFAGGDGFGYVKYKWFTGDNEYLLIRFQKSKTDDADMSSMIVTNFSLNK